MEKDSSKIMAIDEASNLHRRDRPRWAWWLCGTALIIVIAIFTAIQSPAIRHQWELSLSRQTTPYTVLAFSNAATLPTAAVRGKSIHVSFIITNNEGEPVLYSYIVASGSGDRLQLLSSSSEVVAPGETWSVASLITPKCAESPCEIRVSLPKQGDKIDFMVALANQQQKK